MVLVLSINCEGGARSNKKKNDKIKAVIYNQWPKVLHLIEPNIKKEEPLPLFYPSYYEIHTTNDTKKRIITYSLRDYGLQWQEPPENLDCPVTILQGRDITHIGIYSEYTRYHKDGTIERLSNNKKVRINYLINTIKQLVPIMKRIVIIAGDMNTNLKDKNDDPDVRRYLNTLDRLGLEPKIHKVTRPAKYGEKIGSCIDHILVKNMPGEGFVLPLGFGDHHGVGFRTDDVRKMHQRKIITHEVLILDAKSREYGKEIYPFYNPNTDWTDVKTIIKKLEWFYTKVAKFATHKVTKKENQESYWRPSALPLQKAYWADPNNREKKKAYVKHLDELHRQEDERQKQMKGHPFRTEERIELVRLKKEDGTYTKNDDEIAEMLRNHFEQKPKKIVEKSKPNFEPMMKEFADFNKKIRNIPKWMIKLPTEEDIKQLIHDLPEKYSCGEDGLPYTIVKNLKGLSVRPLKFIIGECLKQCYIDGKWLNILVTAIYKKDNTEDVKNYRPIGIGHLLLRLIERWVSKCLLDTVEKYKLLPPNVHGFVPGKGCQTCLEDITEQAEQDKRNGMVSCLVLLDATCAFDAIPRKFILAGLEALQMHPKSLEFMKSYLTDNWFMTVKHNDKRSTKFKNPTGVIQGGGMSATLYVLATAVLEYKLRHIGKLYLYADDSALLISIPKKRAEEMGNLVREAITEIVRVYEDGGLCINEVKSEIMALYGLALTGGFNVKGFECEPKKVIKFLGVQLMHNFRQTEQRDAVLQKLKTMKHKLKRESYNRNMKQKIMMLMAYIMSHINYCKRYWLERTTQEDRKKLQAEVNRSILQIAGVRGYTKEKGLVSRTKLRRSLGLKSVEYMMEEAKMMRALRLGNEFDNQRTRDIEMKLAPVLGDKKGNELRELWHHHPLHLIYKTKDPQKTIKNWLKKVFTNLLEIEQKIGSTLTRPPEFMTTTIAIKWRFEILEALYGDRLRKNGIDIPKLSFLKWKNELKIRF